MPLFEFECLKCKQKFETLCRHNDLEKGISCPYCQNQEVKRLFSTFGLKSGSTFRSSSPSSGCTGCAATSCSTCQI